MPIPNQYQTEEDELARRQSLANMLQQQSMEPIQTQSVGGIPTPISPLQGLSKIYQGYQGGQAQKEVVQGQQDLSKRYQEGLAEALRKSQETGTPDALLMSGHPLAQQIGISKMTSAQASQAAVQKMKEEYGLKKQFEIDPDVIAAKQRSSPQKSDYFVPVQTADGIMSFDSRRGSASPLNVGGKTIVGSASDPKLQGDIARSKESGKATGEVDVSLAAAQASYPQLEDTVKTLKELGKTASYTYADQGRDWIARQAGGTTEGAIAREKYTQTVRDVLFPQLRQTFGAQFTVKEGEALIATMGDPNKSPKEKDAALDAFIEQKKLHIKSLERQTGKGTGPSKDGGVKFLGFE